ncbi:sigma-70 family RNA polymerase sigma factor [Streptomyces sp. NPDC060030]|uniref:sigma-70 family RNA polymerase sigma factor n=1 Tax=Streptomyces sp. NPDC060030 TaxID=3347042 RepID=UPI0036BEA6CD
MPPARTAAPEVLNDGVPEFITLRPRLVHTARRLLGSATEAEDVVQDAWLRWQRTDRAQVLNPSAYLTTTTARLALNVARSARSRHETATPWEVEPTDRGNDPGTRAEQAEALEVAVRLLLEKLKPAERAAYVLRVAFDYPYAQIAEYLRISQGNTRQLVSRAQKHLSADRRRQTVTVVEHKRFLEAFVTAAQSGDLAELERFLETGTGRDPRHHTERTSPAPLYTLHGRGVRACEGVAA